MTHWYNENDRKTAAWLRQLIAEGLLPQGVVDERSIEDVKASDLDGYTQCHFFAGIERGMIAKTDVVAACAMAQRAAFARASEYMRDNHCPTCLSNSSLCSRHRIERTYKNVANEIANLKPR